jgi:hypothetical protein
MARMIGVVVEDGGTKELIVKEAAAEFFCQDGCDGGTIGSIPFEMICQTVCHSWQPWFFLYMHEGIGSYK